MSRPLSLESFDDSIMADGSQVGALSEEEWLKIFEKGYKDGWDDASQAQSETQDKVKTDLASALEQISFTLLEARSLLIKEISPLIKGVLETVLPASLHNILAEQIQTELGAIMMDLTGVEMHLVVSPENRPLLEHLTQNQAHLPVKITGDAALSEGQAYLRFGGQEKKVDLEDALSRVGLILEEFFQDDMQELEQAHG